MGEAGLWDKGGKDKVEGTKVGNRVGDFPKEPRDDEMGNRWCLSQLVVLPLLFAWRQRPGMFMVDGFLVCPYLYIPSDQTWWKQIMCTSYSTYIDGGISKQWGWGAAQNHRDEDF